MKKTCIFIVLLLLGCKEENVLFDQSDIVVPKVFNLSSDNSWDFLRNELSPIRDLVLKDSLLIVNKIFPGPFYYSVYNTRTAEKFVEFGVQGQGPEELPDYSNANLNNKEADLLEIIVPNAGGVIYSVDLKSLRNGDVKLNKVGELGYNPSNFAHVDSGYVIDFGNRFDVVDQFGNHIESAIDYPFEKETALPEKLWNMVHQGLMKKRPEDNRIVFASIYGPNIDLMEYSEGLTSLSKIHVREPKVFDNSGKLASGDAELVGITVSDKNEMGFIDLEVTNNFIYLLYSGRSFEKNGDDALLGSSVYVLDWDGNFLALLNLEKNTRVITVDQSDEILIALDEERETTNLLSYKLPNF
ncbi:BF3164 family lipoprotein [Roseivirga sp.]|uniref:BF3164 family lipoprotein n=1 Tax=Roseivirga sp. TaxID=1964215 RepID=UPI003B51C072